MDIYQEMYNRLTKELEILDKKLKPIEKQIEVARAECNESHNKVVDLKKLLQECNEQKSTEPYIYDPILEFATAILSLVGLAGLILLHKEIVISIFNSINPTIQLPGLSYLFVGYGLPFITMILTAVAEFKILKKVLMLIENKVHKKILDSEDYQNILNRINKLQSELDLAKDEELVKNQNLEEIGKIYLKYAVEVSRRKSSLQYIRLLQETNQDFEKDFATNENQYELSQEQGGPVLTKKLTPPKPTNN